MTPETVALLKKSRDSLDAAKLLAGKNMHDFAASRAYYAMFYVAEACLLSRGMSFSKHSAVISAFGLHFTKTGASPAEYHRYLIEGFDLRNLGDYDAGSTLTDFQSALQISHAEEFLNWGEMTLRGLDCAGT